MAIWTGVRGLVLSSKARQHGRSVGREALALSLPLLAVPKLFIWFGEARLAEQEESIFSLKPGVWRSEKASLPPGMISRPYSLLILLFRPPSRVLSSLAFLREKDLSKDERLCYWVTQFCQRARGCCCLENFWNGVSWREKDFRRTFRLPLHCSLSANMP